MTGTGRILLAFSLAADAFAAALSLGAAHPEKSGRLALQSGLLFGGFQGLMPALGYAVGGLFASALWAFSKGISFFLLAFLSVRMMLSGKKEEQTGQRAGTLWLLALATSIDAWAAGIPLLLEGEPLLFDLCLIALVTGFLSAAGVLLGALLGAGCRRQASFLGGLLLLLPAMKFLAEWIGK